MYARDREGIGIVQGFYGSGSQRQAEFCPDIAFALDAMLPERIDIRPPISLPGTIPVIGININGLLYNGGYNRKNMFGLKMDYAEFSSSLVKRLLEETTCRVMLVPHTFNPPIESDPDASLKVRDSVPAIHRERVHIVTGEYDQSEMKGIIGLCEFFVGARMHACIAALSQGIPTVGVAYSRKFQGVFGSIGEGDMVIDGRETDSATAVDRVMKAFVRREERKEELKIRANCARSMIAETFEEIV